MNIEPSLYDYARVADTLLGQVHATPISRIGLEQTVDGVCGRYVPYGRSFELHLWIPKMYALMQRTKETSI